MVVNLTDCDIKIRFVRHKQSHVQRRHFTYSKGEN